MKHELSRVILVMALAVVAGLITGQVLACLLVAAGAIILWQVWLLGRFKAWLKAPKSNPFPVTDSVFEQLVTEVEQLRKRNKRRKRTLRKYLKQFRTAASAIPDAILLIDQLGRIEWVNPAAERYFGIQWPRDSGQRITNLARHPEFVGMVNNALEEPAGHKTQHTIEFPSPAEGDIILSISFAPYTDGLSLLVARDVTRLVEINTMQKDFVANVSHELRTPLTVLRGYLETMAGHSELAPVLKKPVDNMQHQTKRMQALVQDLLFLSKLEHEASPDFTQDVDVPRLIVDIQDSARELGEQKRHLIELDIDTGLHLYGNAGEIRSAFANLVFNAVKYTPAQGVIRLKWFFHLGGANFVVEDNGAGIAEKHLNRLTERFYRVDVDRSRDTGGTGLGLAIVKHVVQRHQGTLSISSAMGEGSIFHCKFSPTVSRRGDIVASAFRPGRG